MQVKYIGFRAIGSQAVRISDVFDTMAPKIVEGRTLFFEKPILNSARTIPVSLDPASGFYYGIIISNTAMPDLLTLDSITQETKLYELDKAQIKMNFFIFNPMNNSFLYSYYADSLPPKDFAKILSEPYLAITKSKYESELPSCVTKKQRNELKSKYFPRGRHSLQFRPILSRQTFDELLRQSKGVFDIDIDIDLEVLVPNLSSTTRALSTVKTTTLRVQFDKNNLRFSKRMVNALLSLLHGESHRARILEQANDRIIYGTNNKEHFHVEPYSVLRPYLSVALTDFKTCPIFCRMTEMVDGEPIFGFDVIPTDDPRG